MSLNSPLPHSQGILSTPEAKSSIETSTIHQLHAMLALSTNAYINQQNRELLRDCLNELLLLKCELLSTPTKDQQFEKDMISPATRADVDVMTVPESAMKKLVDAESKVSNATIDTAYRLIMELYHGILEEERLHCQVSMGGESGTEDNICLGWGTIFCFIERKSVQVCHTSIEGTVENVMFSMDDVDTLQECASHVRGRMRAFRKWLDLQQSIREERSKSMSHE